MPDAVTILHVSDPATHVGSPAAGLAPAAVDWHLLDAGSPLQPGVWYSISMPIPARLAGLTRADGDAARRGLLKGLLEQLGFVSVNVGYLEPPDAWPLEMPCPGYHPPASAAGGATAQTILQPSPARVTARAVWGGAAVPLGQIGLGTRAMILEYTSRTIVPRAVDGSAALLPSGLWVAPGARGQVVGNSPSEIAAKLVAGLMFALIALSGLWTVASSGLYP